MKLLDTCTNDVCSGMVDGLSRSRPASASAPPDDGAGESPAGTVAVILIAVLTVNVEETPLNLTAVAPVKLAPLS